jgi:hypothetical protein
VTGQHQVLGRRFEFNFGANAVYELHFVAAQHLEVTVIADASYPPGTLNQFEIEMTEIGMDQYMVTWLEPATGNTVTHVEDYGRGIAYTNITDMASRQFWRLKGTIRPLP